MNFARFSIYTSLERNQAIDDVRQAISKSGGWIVDQTLFSNIATCINFEIPPTALKALQVHLADKSLTLHVEGEFPADSEDDVRSVVTITFLHKEPDLRRDVPPFG